MVTGRERASGTGKREARGERERREWLVGVGPDGRQVGSGPVVAARCGGERV